MENIRRIVRQSLKESTKRHYYKITVKYDIYYESDQYLEWEDDIVDAAFQDGKITEKEFNSFFEVTDIDKEDIPDY